MNKINCSEEYLEWIKSDENMRDLTGSQAKFAEFLLEEDNIKLLSQIGDVSKIFDSVYSYVKYVRKPDVS